MAGQILIAGATLNRENSPRYRVGTRRPTVFKTEGQNLKPRQQEQCIEMITPLY
jgi:hypothetical protein